MADQLESEKMTAYYITQPGRLFLTGKSIIHHGLTQSLVNKATSVITQPGDCHTMTYHVAP